MQTFIWKKHHLWDLKCTKMKEIILSCFVVEKALTKANVKFLFSNVVIPKYVRRFIVRTVSSISRFTSQTLIARMTKNLIN